MKGFKDEAANAATENYPNAIPIYAKDSVACIFR
jgi:hypothetical protein